MAHPHPLPQGDTEKQTSTLLGTKTRKRGVLGRGTKSRGKAKKQETKGKVWKLTRAKVSEAKRARQQMTRKTTGA